MASPYKQGCAKGCPYCESRWVIDDTNWKGEFLTLHNGQSILPNSKDGMLFRAAKYLREHSPNKVCSICIKSTH